MTVQDKISAIEQFKFDANSEASKEGLFSLYKTVFGKEFDKGCGACYQGKWQDLKKFKRDESIKLHIDSPKGKAERAGLKYKFKSGHPVKGYVNITAGGMLVAITPDNLTNVTAEILLSSKHYSNMIEEINPALIQKKEEPVVSEENAAVQSVSTSTEPLIDGRQSASSEVVSGTQPVKEVLSKKEQRRAKKLIGK